MSFGSAGRNLLNLSIRKHNSLYCVHGYSFRPQNSWTTYRKCTPRLFTIGAQNTVQSSTDAQGTSNGARQTPPKVETFSDPARPKPNPRMFPLRDLPRKQRRWPKVLAMMAIGLPIWAGFLFTVWNQESLSSSVFKQTMRVLREDGSVRGILGDAVRIEPVWWLNGDGIVWGKISTMSGSVDISFRVKGTKGTGTVYFTSIRKEKGHPFTILRFRLISDDGKILNVQSADRIDHGEALIDS